MNITVRVAAARAQAQLKQLQGQVAMLERQLATASAAGGSFIGDKHISAMAKWGNQVQWTGRQISHNFTLPLVIAGAAATKWQLDNEKAFTQVQKVYGDTQAAAAFFMKSQKGLTQEMANQKATATFNSELTSLQKNFKALSNYYGVNQAEVTNVAAAWAAAGASGKELAIATDATMKAIILGDMDSAAATQALISIQSQYTLSSSELMKTLAQLNAIENQTGISMQGLIQGFERAAGTARTAGVSTRELGAMLAALTPATGSAANAGNALKTILSRLMAPTKQAASVMKDMGINVTDMSWKSATGAERLKIMEGKFNNLTDSGKAFVSSIIASRWQVNKFDVLMRELGSTTGFYQKALDATSSDTKVFQIAQQELNKVLDSNPRKLQIIWTTLQNGAASAIQPLIPYIIWLASVIKDLVVAFQNIPGPIQKLILTFAILLAMFGPLLKYFGSTATLIGQLGLMFGKGLALPVRAASVALVGFRLALSSVATAWGAVVGGMIRTAMFLPGAVITATTAALTAMKIFALNVRVAMALAFLPIRPWLIATLAKVFVMPLAGMVGQALFVLGTLPMLLKGVLGPAVRVIGNIVAGMMLGVMRLGMITGPLTGIWARAGLALNMVWTAMYVAFMSTFGLLPRIAAAAAAGVTTIWSALAARMVVIQAAMTTRVVTIFAAMETGILTIMTRLRAFMAAIWISIALMPARFMAVMVAMPARIGPAVASIGARVATLGPMILAGLARIGPMLLRVVTGPVGLIVTGVVALIVLLRKQLVQIWTNIVSWWNGSNNNLVSNIIKAWYALPQGVQNALMAVARIVSKIAMKIYELFSYINPFAHHSPSLVENVTKGMAIIGKQFSSLDSIKGHIAGAYAAIKSFGGLVASLGLDSFSQDLAQVKQFAPQLTSGFTQLHGVLTVLNADMKKMEATIAAQQSVVNKWQAALDAANSALDKQQTKLDALQKVSSNYSDLLDAAKQKLSNWADTPIQGMQAMSDAIFSNEMAQKKLRLEMLKMEQVNGTLDSLQSKMAGLNGTIETLKADQADLRGAGAGSDITGYYNDQITALEGQKQALNDQMKPFNDLNKALDDLQRKGDILDLTNSLQFDPLTRQIELASKALKEMPFATIMAGVTAAAADVDKYTKALATANLAVDAQKKIVDAMTVARDATSKSLDLEKAKLDTLNNSYSALKDAVNAVEQAMRDMTTAAQAADQAAKAKKTASAVGSKAGGAMSLADANGGKFPDVGGTGIQVRKDWTDQSASIDKLTKDLMAKSNAAFAGIDMFGPVKKKWNELKGWISKNIGPIASTIGDFFSHVFDNVKGINWSGIFHPFVVAWDWIIKVGKSLGKLFGPSFKEIVDSARKGIKQFWDQVGPALAGLKDLVKPLQDAWQRVWPILKVAIGILIGLLLLSLRTAFDILGNILGPIIQMIGGILRGLILIFKGVVQGVLAIINGDWKLAFTGLWNIVKGAWDIIWSIFKGIGKTLFGIVKGVVEGIVGFFSWLYNVLVGHSIIPDLVNAIVRWFKYLITLPMWIWNNVLLPIYNFFKNIWVKYLLPIVTLMIHGIVFYWQGLKALVLWIWNNVLVPLYNLFKNIWATYLQPKVAAIAAGITSAWQKIKSLVKWTQDTFITPIKSAFDSFVTAVGKIFDKIQSKVSGPIDKIKGWINNNLIDPLNKVVKLFGLTIPKLATGGGVSLAGHGSNSAGRLANGGKVKGFSSSSKADNIPIWATANEYMQPVSAVRHYGLPFMEAIRKKQIPKDAFSTGGFALGGQIGKQIQGWMEKGPEFAVNNIMNPAIKTAGNAFPSPEFANKMATGSVGLIRDDMLKYIKTAGGTGSGGLPSNPGLAGAAAWAQSQVGKPYIWGGVGPDGYDCSGFMSAITNYIQGRPLYQRRFATGSMPAGVFEKGPGAFSVAWFKGNPGHTAGTLNGMNVESRGGKGVVTGASARGATNSLFNSGIYHLPGFAKGGRIGDAPFDLMDKRGKAFNPALAPGLLFDSGGYLPPGMSTVVNNTKQPEPVFAPNDWKTMRSFVKSSTDNTRNAPNNSGSKTYNFHNTKFEFPNIKSGDDAEAFLDNLEGLVG